MINKNNIEQYITLSKINPIAKIEHGKPLYVISPNRSYFGVIGEIDLTGHDAQECVVYGFDKLVRLCNNQISRGDEPVIRVGKSNMEVSSKDNTTKIVYSNEQYKDIEIDTVISSIKPIARVELSKDDIKQFKDTCTIMGYNHVTFNKTKNNLTMMFKSDNGINSFTGNETETELKHEIISQTIEYRCSIDRSLMFDFITNDDYELTIGVNSVGAYVGALKAKQSEYNFIFFFKPQ